jgi:hypothetical protein
MSCDDDLQNEFDNGEASAAASAAKMSCDDDLRNGFDNATAASTAKVTIDNVYELFDNYDNSFKNKNYSSENESLLEDNDSFDDNDDNDTVDILHEGLYSDDELLSDFDDANLEDNNSIYNISVEHNINDEITRGLRLLEIKARRNITDAAFKEIVTAANGISTSIYILIKTLKNMVPLKPIWVDMCINSCCAFTGNFKTLNKCIYCKAERYQEGRQSRAQVAYFSIQDRFVIQYQDSTRAKQLRYRSEYIAKEEYNINNTIGDVFDSAQYKYLSQKGYFQDDRDIALLGSIDGYQLFRQKCDDCWIVLFINANLPPEQRVKKENLLITSIIPGPKAPKDFNSFMKPIVEELCLLEGNFIKFI